MITSTSLKRDLLAECADDHVGLWSVIAYVEDELPEADEETLRTTTIALLGDLLAAGCVEAGFPDSDGRHFHAWPFTAQVVLDYIESQWKPGSPRPDVGEICWFTTPSPLSVPKAIPAQRDSK